MKASARGGSSDATDDTSVAQRIRASRDRATTSEQHIARVILSDYPSAGLQSAARLAELAGTSAPTVVRYVARLGFAGYRDFQGALRQELTERQASPLTLASRASVSEPDAAEKVLQAALYETLHNASPVDMERSARLLADPHRRVITAGGRFTRLLAEYLHLHLRLIRSGTTFVPSAPEELCTSLIDVDRKTVCVLFDFRRYDVDMVEYARAVRQRGARLVVVTDPWLSPAAANAHHVLIARVEAASPFDSIVAAAALVETLLVDVYGLVGKSASDRVGAADELRRKLRVE